MQRDAKYHAGSPPVLSEDTIMRPVLNALFALALFLAVGAHAQEVGDRIQLVGRAIGIPGHPGPGINAVSHRYPSRAIVEEVGKDTATGWFEVMDAAGNAAWITPSYILALVGESEFPSD